MRMYKQENHDLDSYDIIDNSPNNLKGEVSKLDMRILNIMRIAAAKDDMLAAYKARKKCYQLCKEETNQSDYKEHVESLLLDNFPNELKKADHGNRYVILLKLLVFLLILATPFVVYGGWSIIYELAYEKYPFAYTFHDNNGVFSVRQDTDLVLGVVASIAVSIVLGVIIKYVIKKMCTISQSIKDIK